jgi:hypothetical protein
MCHVHDVAAVLTLVGRTSHRAGRCRSEVIDEPLDALAEAHREAMGNIRS